MNLLPLVIVFLLSVRQSQTLRSTKPPSGAIAKLIRLGFLAVEEVVPQDIGHPVTGGAVSVAIDRIRDEHLLDGYNFTATVIKTECVPDATVGAMVAFTQTYDVDAVIGPPCGGRYSGTMSTAYRVPLLAWGYSMSTILTDRERFPLVTSIISSSLSIAYAFLNVCARNNWNTIALLYTTQDVNYCTSIMDSIDAASNDASSYNMTIVMRGVLDANDNATYYSRLAALKQRARIVGICMAGVDKRRLFARLNQLEMISPEYVYVILELKSIGFGQVRRTSELLPSGLSPFWSDAFGNNSDGLTELARQGARRAIVLDLNRREDLDLDKFTSEVLARITQWPMFCNWTSCVNATTNYKQAGIFARHLHDVVYYYARLINRTLTAAPDGGVRNADVMITQLADSFDGMSGSVEMTATGTRNPVFFLYGLNPSGVPRTLANVTVETSTLATVGGCIGCVKFTPVLDDATMWQLWGGFVPSAVPACGFLGDRCPREWWTQNLPFVLIGVAVFVLLMLLVAAFVIYFMWERRREIARQNAEWQIAHHTLEKPPSKKERSSMRSLQSSGIQSTSTKLTLDSVGSSTGATVFIYNKEYVVASTHGSYYRFEAADEQEFRAMRKLDHNNVNRFVGLVLDGPALLSIWRFCSRGSIAQVIEKGSMQLDGFFVLSLIRDIANGIGYLHESFLGCHGNLTSSTCLVDDRWQVKLTDYGIRSLRLRERSKRKQLWLAPEQLRVEMASPTPTADIYAFAIICAELITRKPAWNAGGRKEKIDELVYLIKKGGSTPLRPPLFSAEGVEVAPALLHLVRDCWSERPDDRPKIDTVRSILRSMSSGGQQNLMDHVFNMMEQYANTLEEDVADRTKELVEEKKKSDVLLFRMLPRQVAEKLKLGQSVEPESFESVTIFFSDVVKFTALSQKCTPIQIVNLLNDLYTTFDTIIENHGIYKVETIGDGYLCVSGLPRRNGTQHVRDISELALDFLDAVAHFRVPHLPQERVQLRVGMNTGPCVAGVVGLAMPRYCLFGDTVNTGSRMESNGRPSHIHMTAESNRLLTIAYPGVYRTESRGEVIIKGKGVMETFWLLGRADNNNLNETPPIWKQQQKSMDTPPPRKSASPPPSEPELAALVPDTDALYNKALTARINSSRGGGANGERGGANRSVSSIDSMTSTIGMYDQFVTRKQI